MNVHIVVNRIHDDWVIARLCNHLVTHNGWSWGQRPRRDARVNIFFPYLEWRHTEWRRRQTAAWMTHRRDSDWGAEVWEQTAGALSLRVTPAALWLPELETFGPSAHIPHPVELDMFRPSGRERTWDDFTIGVSGIVRCNDGERKGGHLVERLMREGWTVRASGRGWPCPTRWYEWHELPEFYQSLDVFLCTSTNEGGPVTVLEALASGVPVVIPWDVGQCPEYPERAGIRHYRKGDYEDLERALVQVFEESPYLKPEALRAVAEQYPISRWCRDWEETIYKLIGGANV